MLYPFLLTPVLKTPLWSGRRLIKDYGKAESEKIGESWELSARPDAAVTVKNGPLAGTSLYTVFEKFSRELIGDAPLPNGGFPLLVKLIDAALPLSVQVHPDGALAKRLGEEGGKTELWYILDAEKDAAIYYGLRDGISEKEAAAALQGEGFDAVLRRIPVQRGEVYFLPAGLPHAIGEGVLLAEVQENSDVTYRLYDYGRRDEAGKLRPLHVEKGTLALRTYSDREIEELRFASGKTPRDGDTLLAATPYFRAELLSLLGEATLPRRNYLRHLLCLEGKATLREGDTQLSFQKGDSILLPAALGNTHLEGEGTILLSSL